MVTKTKEVIYKGSKGLFGTAHLVFTTLADLSISAEIAVAKRTGHVNNDDDVDALVINRIKTTDLKQQRMNEAFKKYGHLFDGVKLKAVS